VPSWVLRFSGFGVLGLNSLWVLLGSFVGCSQVLLLGFRVLLNAFCGLNLVVLVYTQFFLLIKKKSFWTDVACARVMRNLWTTFFFTVMWLTLCGITFLLVLVCLGLCLEELSTCLLVGGSLEGREVLRFGRWCQSTFFSVWKERYLRCF